VLYNFDVIEDLKNPFPPSVDLLFEEKGRIVLP
jgi:hypothetical protein